MVFLTASCLHQVRGIMQRQGTNTAGYKPEGDLTVLLEVLSAFLLLGGLELSDVGEVALLYVLVDTLQHGLLRQGLYGLLLNGSSYHTESESE